MSNERPPDDLPPAKSDLEAFLDAHPGAPWALLMVGIMTLAGGLIAWCNG